MNEKTPIQGIIFDYGNVICLPQLSADVAEMAGLCGISVAQFLAIYWRLRLDYDRADLDGKTFWSQVLAGGEAATPELIAALTAIDIRSWSRLNEGTLHWLRSLHRCGMPLALISNMPTEIARHVEQHSEWAQYFNPLIFSCDYNSTKPDRLLYEKCLARFPFAPNGILFLDDRSENVRAAADMGMQGLLFDGIEGVLEEVRKRFHFEPPN